MKKGSFKLLEETKEGYVSLTGAFGIYKGYKAWAVCHIPTGLHTGISQRTKALVEATVLKAEALGVDFNTPDLKTDPVKLAALRDIAIASREA